MAPQPTGMTENDQLVYLACQSGRIKVDAGTGQIYTTKGHGGVTIPPKPVSYRSGRDGYQQFDIQLDKPQGGSKKITAYAHRVVFLAVHGPIPEGYQVDHIDRNHQNNSPINLRLTTRVENSANRGEQTGERNPAAKLDWPRVREIRRLYNTGKYSQRTIADQYGVAVTTVRSIVKNQSWLNDPGEDDEHEPSVLTVEDEQTLALEALPEPSPVPQVESKPVIDIKTHDEWVKEQNHLLWAGIDLETNLQRYEEVKATYARSFGNAARTARVVGLHPDTVRLYATRDDWPVMPTSREPISSAEKGSRTRLEATADMLYARMWALADSLIVEEKDRNELTEKGLSSTFVAKLNERSGTFKNLFDSWMRCMTLLEPETFAADTDKNNPQALRLQRQRELNEGVAGIERQFAALIAGINLGASADRPTVVDAVVVDQPERGSDTVSTALGLVTGDEHRPVDR